MPSRSTFIFILFLTAIAGLLGWNYLTRPFESLSDEQPEVAAGVTPTPESDASLDAAVAALSAEEKISLLMAAPVTISNTASRSADLGWISVYKPGFVTLFGNQVSTAAATKTISEIKTNYESSELPLILVDHEGGTVQRLNGSGFTDLPSWQSLCTQPATRSATVLQQSARELRSVGIDVVLAPTIDVASSHAVLKNRVCASTPDVVAEQAATFIEVFESEGIVPVLKHYPGIGQTKRDLHTQFDRVTVTANDARLYKVLLDRYSTVGVMSSHVGVTNQYPDIPCSLSLDCIRELVSNYPQIIVFSDALEMEAASFMPNNQAPLTLPEVAVKAVRAGNTVLVFGPSVADEQLSDIHRILLGVYEQDRDFKNSVDQSVKRIVQLQGRRS